MDGGGMGGMGGGGMGGGGGMEGGGAPRMPEVKALVRWETALPVLDAAKRKLPKEAEGSYIISVSGLQGMRRGGLPEGKGGDTNPEQARARMEGRMRESTKIERKKHEPLTPETVRVLEQGQSRAFLFTFPKSKDPITAEEKEVTFVTRVGPMEVRAKFQLKDMLYQGQLQL